ncbi:MAG: transcription-repair coupling factor, partial [Actinobacteria bacterium]|nr:transcription-repair coupling factor [Actinomycetota bacterium]
CDREELILKLSDMGYERVNRVFDKGEFSARGDIIDVFDITLNFPLRIDMLDKTINKIMFYNLSDQSIIERVNRVSIFSKLSIFNDAEQNGVNDAEKESGYVSFISFFATCVNNFGFIVCDPVEVELKIKSDIDLIKKSVEIKDKDNSGASFDKNRSNIPLKEINRRIISPDFLKEGIPKNSIYRLDLLSSEFEGEGLETFSFNRISKQKKSYGRSEIFIQSLKKDLNNKKVVIISSANTQRTDKIKQLLLDSKISFKNYLLKDSNQSGIGNKIPSNQYGTESSIPSQQNDIEGPISSQIRFNSLDKNLVNILNAELFNGYKTEEISLYGELDIYEQLEKDAVEQKSIFDAKHEDFLYGDYVVHKTHGIGKYIGTVSEQLNGAKREYFLIEYAGNDKLYVPTWHADRVTKYIGDRTPSVTSLTSKQWDTLKKKVRSSVHKLAIDLASLYSERNKLEGYAYPLDSIWQKEMEELFPFSETDDQIKAVNYVKDLMQKPRPMDLLVCGDVGFGKTEVAVRAAFKAVENAKQVLMLVPTTILADQHFRTFSERYKNFPVIVELISRFRSKREQKEILKRFCDGKIDMLIGTHRILSEDIKPKDLGLIIVDEEHRFGVNAKEKIKLLKKEVDVMTLTATPIPRTLYMSLTGIRDVSLIETHPAGRFPVETFVGAKNDFVIRMAVEREIKRGGQVYYVFNRIRDINEKKIKLQTMMPDIRIALTHGRMDGKEIEKVMKDFLDKKYDVLLTTTIIESGMDISNVNTLIVEDSHRFGLAQLYQIRGRVGRSWQKAYAYFFYPDRRVLKLAAFQRLKTLTEHTDLGSGYKIAMRDLEIRGAGELLGARQHGHINSVGFDLYCQIVKEEVDKLKGLTVEEDINIQIELPVSAYIPKNFIRSENDRIKLYKSLGSIDSEAEAENIVSGLEKRYGNIPEVVTNLVNIAKIKCLSKKAEIERVIYLRSRGIVLRKVQLSRYKIEPLEDKYPMLSYVDKNREVLIKTGDEKIDAELIIKILNDIISLALN